MGHKLHDSKGKFVRVLTDEEREENKKQYYLDHKDRIIKNAKDNYLKNKDKIKEYKKLWRIKNSETIKQKKQVNYNLNKKEILEKQKIYNQGRKEILKEYKKKYHKCNAEKHKEKSRKYFSENKEKLSQLNKLWKINNREAHNKQRRERIKNDKNFMLSLLLRNRVHSALSKNRIYFKPGSTVKDLGCPIPEFIVYIESKFTEGMTWENRGLKGWHFDHIKPLSLFDLTDINQFKEACHYTNIQPLWAVDNMKKGNKYVSI